MRPLRFDAVSPVFRIFDVAKAREFYVEWLGFTVEWEHRFGEDFPLYLQISRDGLVLHLSEHHGDACPGSTVLVETTGLDALEAELASRPFRYLRPAIQPVPWGGRELVLLDPFGNRLRLWEPGD